MNALTAAASHQWAMLPDKLESLLEIAAREHEISVEAIEAYKSRSLENTQRAKTRDATAIVYLEGPLFKRANILADISGATSYEIAALDFTSALENPNIHSIALHIDSPGGEVSGCDEFANMVFEARGKKPITAFVSGMAASAAYWIASAADRIVVSDTAILGSIGVVLSASSSEPRGGKRTYEFVSSQSPNKRPDMETDAGKAQIQKRVDALASVFISTVARNRGISSEAVVLKFGQGGVEVGAAAVALGMADAVGSFEGVVADLAKRGSRRSTPVNNGVYKMTDKTNGGEENTVDVANERAQATKAAHERIQAVLDSEVAAAMPKGAKFLAFDAAFSSISGTDIVRALAAFSGDIKAVEPTPVLAANADEKSKVDENEYLKTKANSISLAAPNANPAGKTDVAADNGWGAVLSEMPTVRK